MLCVCWQVSREDDNVIDECSDILDVFEVVVDHSLERGRNGFQPERTTFEHLLDAIESEGCFVLVSFIDQESMESILQVQVDEDCSTR